MKMVGRKRNYNGDYSQTLKPKPEALRPLFNEKTLGQFRVEAVTDGKAIVRIYLRGSELSTLHRRHKELSKAAHDFYKAVKWLSTSVLQGFCALEPYLNPSTLKPEAFIRHAL